MCLVKVLFYCTTNADFAICLLLLRQTRLNICISVNTSEWQPSCGPFYLSVGVSSLVQLINEVSSVTSSVTHHDILTTCLCTLACVGLDQVDPLCFATVIRSHPGQNATFAFVENNNQPVSNFSKYVNYSIKITIINQF